MSAKRRYATQLTLKFLFIALCLVLCFGGNHPPSLAQARQYVTVPTVTTEDALQDSDIAALNKHLEASDSRLAEYVERIDANSEAVSGIKGEERAIGAGLAILQVLALFFQVKRRES